MEEKKVRRSFKPDQKFEILKDIETVLTFKSMFFTSIFPC